MEITEKAIQGMQHHLDACNKYLAELAKGYRSPEKCNTLLDAAMQQVELCCIDMRLLCEKACPRLPDFRFGAGKYNFKAIYGKILSVTRKEPISCQSNTKKNSKSKQLPTMKNATRYAR